VVATATLVTTLLLARLFVTRRPIIELSTQRVELGIGAPGEVLHGAFNIANVGQKPLMFDIAASCGCSDLAPRRGTVQPGGVQEVAMNVRLPEVPGDDRDLSVVVTSNDSEKPDVRCQVVAKSRPAPFVVTPEYVDFGRVSPDSVAKLKPIKFELTANPDAAADSLERDDLSRIAMMHSSDAFHVSQNPDLEATMLTYQVKLIGESASGDIYDSIELRLPDSPYVVCVPVHVWVCDSISAVPSKVTVRPGELRNENATLAIVLVSHDGPVEWKELTIVDDSETMRVTNLVPLGERRCRIQVALNHRNWMPEAEVQLKLTTKSSNHERSIVPLTLVQVGG
jgi:hypothetical protein